MRRSWRLSANAGLLGSVGLLLFRKTKPNQEPTHGLDPILRVALLGESRFHPLLRKPIICFREATLTYRAMLRAQLDRHRRGSARRFGRQEIGCLIPL